MYNSKFIKYIHDVEIEGGEVTLTQGFDSTIAICHLKGMGDPWITLCECFEGQEDFSMINLTGASWDALKRAMVVAEETKE